MEGRLLPVVDRKPKTTITEAEQADIQKFSIL